MLQNFSSKLLCSPRPKTLLRAGLTSVMCLCTMCLWDLSPAGRWDLGETCITPLLCVICSGLGPDILVSTSGLSRRPHPGLENVPECWNPPPSTHPPPGTLGFITGPKKTKGIPEPMQRLALPFDTKAICSAPQKPGPAILGSPPAEGSPHPGDVPPSTHPMGAVHTASEQPLCSLLSSPSSLLSAPPLVGIQCTRNK